MPGYGTLSPEGVGFLRPPKSRCLAGLQCWFLLMLPQYVTYFRFMLLLWSKLSGPDISPELSEICKILLLNESSWRGLSCLWPAIARSPAACREAVVSKLVVGLVVGLFLSAGFVVQSKGDKLGFGSQIPGQVGIEALWHLF